MPDEQDKSITPAPAVQVAVAAASPYHAYLASLGPRSRRTQASALGHVCRTVFHLEPEELYWGAFGLKHLSALRSWLVELVDGAPRYAPATANRILSAFRQVLRAARRLGQMDERTYQETADVKRVPGHRLVSGRAITQGELRAIFGALDPRRPLDARNAALVALLYGGGLRRQEACDLDLDSIDADGAVRVIGKGNKERRAFLPAGARAAVRAWLRHRGDRPGPLLLAIDHGRTITGRRLSAESVSHTVGVLGQKAGIARFASHDLRRTYCSDLLDAGADTVTVQRLMGHSSPVTTSGYDRRPDRARSAAVDLLCVPFVELHAELDAEPEPAPAPDVWGATVAELAAEPEAEFSPELAIDPWAELAAELAPEPEPEPEPLRASVGPALARCIDRGPAYCIEGRKAGNE